MISTSIEQGTFPHLEGLLVPAPELNDGHLEALCASLQQVASTHEAARSGEGMASLLAACDWLEATLRDAAALEGKEGPCQGIRAAMQLTQRGLGKVLEADTLPPLPSGEPGVRWLARVVASYLGAAHQAYFSEGWLRASGAALFAQLASDVREWTKETLMPRLCALIAQLLATEEPSNRDAALEVHAASLARLLHTGRMCAVAITGGNSGDAAAAAAAPAVPPQFRSFAVLNVSWASAVKLLLAVPAACSEGEAAAIGEPKNRGVDVSQVVRDVIAYLGHGLAQYVATRENNHLQVCRFWLQHLFRLTQAFGRETAGQCSAAARLHANAAASVAGCRTQLLQQQQMLAAAAVDGADMAASAASMHQVDEAAEGFCQAMDKNVLPWLQNSVLNWASAVASNPMFLRAVLEAAIGSPPPASLSSEAAAAAAAAAGPPPSEATGAAAAAGPPPSGAEAAAAGQPLCVAARHLPLVLALLRKARKMPRVLLAAACSDLVPGLVDSMCGEGREDQGTLLACLENPSLVREAADACVAVAAAAAAADAGGRGAACGGGGGAEASPWATFQGWLFRSALRPHPVRLRLLSEVWASITSAASADLAYSHASGLRTLMRHAAAAEAVDRCSGGCGPGTVTRQVTSLAAAVMTSITSSTARGGGPGRCQPFLSVLQGHLQEASLDSAIATTLFCADLRLLQRCCPAAAALVPSAPAPASAAAANLELPAELARWLGAQALPEALQRARALAARATAPPPTPPPQQQQGERGEQQGGDAGVRDASLHLAWLLALAAEAVRAVGEQQARAANPSVLSGCCDLACGLVGSAVVVARDAGGGAGVAVAPLHTAAALRLLGVLRSMVPPEAIAPAVPSLLALHGITEMKPHVARLLPCFVASASPPAPLFHAALCEPHWCLSHEAVEALVAYSRGAVQGELLPLLPAPLRGAGGGAAAAGFVAAMQQHLARAPAAAPGAATGVLLLGPARAASAGRQEEEGEGAPLRQLIRALAGNWALDALRQQQLGSGAAAAAGGGELVSAADQFWRALLHLEACAESTAENPSSGSGDKAFCGGAQLLEQLPGRLQQASDRLLRLSARMAGGCKPGA